MRTEGMKDMKEKKKWWGQGFYIHYTVSNPMQREGFTLYRNVRGSYILLKYETVADSFKSSK